MLGLGTTLNERYRIDRMLEINALGARYRAFDLEREVQITVAEILPQPGTREEELAELQIQFEQEAQSLQNLQHPNIAKVVDYFLMQEEGTSPIPSMEFNRISQPNAYIVTEYVEGESLARIIERNGAQAESNVTVWATDLLNALEYSHRHNVYHHDIQPKAIIITPENRAVLVGYEVMGLWKVNDPSTWTAKRVMGVPEFASPERWTNQNWREDPTSDLYSLGATLYTALTGEIPTNAGDRMANPYQFVQVKTLSPYVSAQTKDVILKAMSLVRNKRFRSASDMLKALKSPNHHAHRDADPAPAPFASMHHKPAFPWLGLVGILFSTAVIFGAGLLGLRLRNFFHPQTYSLSTATPTTEILSLEQALSNESTVAPTEDTSGEVPQPTTIVLSTATPIPDIGTILGEEGADVPSAWNVAIDDPFDDNGFAWPVGQGTGENAISRTIKNGVYRWELNADSPIGRWCTPDNAAQYGDMLVSVSAHVLDGPEAASYGLIIRSLEIAPDIYNYYVFSVRNDNFYQVKFQDSREEGEVILIDWTSTTAINPEIANTITVKAQGSHFEFYINDTFIDELEDDRQSTGEAGLIITTGPFDGTVIYEFDNFTQHTPDSVLIRRSE